jgi:hypothetical protein
MSSLDLQLQVWIPCPDCAPFHLRCPADTLALAGAWPELPIFGMVMALLDADQRIEMIVVNPSPDLVFTPDRIERPGIPRPVRGVALLSIGSVDEKPPIAVFAELQRRYRDAGIRLVDWVLIDFEASSYLSMRVQARQNHGVAVDYLRAGTCV